MTRTLPRAGLTTVGSLSREVDSIGATCRCDEVDERLRRNPELRCLVAQGEDGRIGLISRSEFQQRMAGPLGFGRVVFGRRPVGELTDWDPLVMMETVELSAAAQQVLARDASVSDVLVVGADARIRQLSVRELFQALAAQYAERAVTDPLTGLGNRDLFLDHLALCCSDVNGGAGRVAVMYIDLDGFKSINDTYGHHAGDVALRTVADRLRECFRADDVIARLGGDEFAVLLRLDATPRLAEPGVVALGSRVLTALSEVINAGGAALPGRASIGLAISSNRDVDPETLLREADLAMYRAKASGGSAVELVRDVQSALTGVANVRPADRDRLLRGLEAREFVLHYQPIVHVHSGRLASLEALVRWAHPERGLLGPGEFLQSVEDAGLAVELGAYVLAEACAQLRRWRQALGELAPRRVNVNLSVRQLLDASLVGTVLSALAENDLLPCALRLELPEVATVAQMQQARTALAELRAAGVAITLDDLGAGASSLTHLTQVALDGIKIDRQFVAGMLEDDRDMAVVRMLLEMAAATGLSVTAEGVETEAQLSALRQLSAGRPSYLQGFLISRPLAPTDLQLPWPAGQELSVAVG